MSKSLQEERLQILNMVEEGKINSKDAIDLLNALEEKGSITTNSKAKWLKVRVYEPNDETKVNINIPIALVNVGLKLANKFSPHMDSETMKDIDINEIMNAVKSGAHGKIVEVHNEKNGEKVEIYVE